MKISSLPGLLIALLFSISTLRAQPLEVTDGATAPFTPENLISNIFLGEGVEVTDIQFYGVPTAVGYFKNAEDEIGIDRGIIMTTGAVTQNGNFVGVDNVGNAFASSDNNAMAANNDPDLQAISTNQVFNAAKYVITFIPTSDTLRFNYIWASEEYPEWACTSFNDVFGFFLSGPGINGPYENNGINLAIIPGTNLPVAINNLHPQNGSGCPPLNEQFYVDNNGSSNQPVYDGFTTVLTAEAVVTPCEPYTIKLVIADNGDGIYDSGVFLEAKSFGTGSLDVEVVTTSLDGAITEGCADALLTFELPTPTEVDYPIDFSLLGDAINGIDYDFIDTNNVFIPAGDSSVTLVLHGIEDGISEGSEYLAIDIQRDICNRDTFFLYIKDPQLIPPELGNDTTLCLLEPVQLDGTIDIPLPPPPTFSNTQDYIIDPVNTSIYSPITVGGVLPAQLGPGVIQSVCINIEHNWLDDLDIYLVAPSGMFMELSTDNGSNGDDYIQTCFTADAITPIDYVMPPASGAPYTGNFLPEGVWEDLWSAQDNPTNGTWQLLVIDDALGFVGTLLDWSITFYPEYQVYYEWTPSTGLSCDDCPNPVATPPDTTTYYLHAYDSYGCEVFDSITINTIPVLPAPEVSCSITNDTCVTFTWNPVAGASGYEVSLDGGASWIPPNGGSFSHTVCVGFEQEASLSVRANDNCGGFPAASSCTTPACSGGIPQIVQIQDVDCYGNSNGSVEVTATGPGAPFTFTLGTETNATGLFENLPAGDYTISVTNQVNCVTSIDVAISQPWLLSTNIGLEQAISCSTAQDGSLAALPNGGTPPYNYLWSNGQTDSIATNLASGTVSLTITDANGCQAQESFTLDAPPPMFVNTTASNVACFGDSSGTAVALVSGGISPYSYLWSSGDTLQAASNLPAGTYTVTVTDSNNCMETASVTIDQNPPISLSTDYSPPACLGYDDGSATVTASGGGSGTFFYQWDANAGNQTTATATGLSAGTYFVTVSNTLGCSNSISVLVEDPPGMDIDLQTGDASCDGNADGSAMLTVSGGTPDYQFIWSDGGPNVPGRTDLPQGNYSVSIQDANGCEQVLNFTISAPQAMTLDFNAEMTSCDDSSDGSATALPSGGTPAYSYLWEDGQTTQTAVNLPEGSYSVTITDNNGCQISGAVSISSPPPISLSLNMTQALCFGSADGTATVQASGGTPPYTYLWSDGQTTPTATALAAGTYTVTVTDSNNCTAEESIEVSEPPALQLNTSAQPVSCDGTPDGTATAEVSGGTPPYNYLWSNGQTTPTATDLDSGEYQVSVTDANGCQITGQAEVTAPPQLLVHIEGNDVSCFQGSNGSLTAIIDSGTSPVNYLWSTGDTTQTISGLMAGSYTVTVSDGSDCETIASAEVNQPEALSANLTQQAASCHNAFDGTATIAEVFYGTTPVSDLSQFTFQWNTTPPQTGQTAYNLQGGSTVSVLITDPLGCSIEASITVGNPEAVNGLIESQQDASCYGSADGSATAFATGGTPPYTYLWSSNAGSQTTATASDLPAGEYQVTIYDSEGCTAFATAEINQPQPLQSQLTAQDANCFGFAQGSATVQAQGGTPPYDYSWSNGNQGAQQTELEAGWYYLTITDSHGCTKTDSVEVGQPEAPLTLEAQGFDPSCFGKKDGYIALTPQGGTPPYSFSTDNGQTFGGSSYLYGLTAGTYYVLAQDARGCQFQVGPIDLQDPPEILLDLGPDTTLEYLEQIQLNAEVSNAHQPYSYQWWAVGPGTLDCYDCPTPLTDPMTSATTFWLEITDGKGCTQQDKILVYVRENNLILVPTAFSPNGDGINDLLLVHGSPGAQISLFRVFDRWGELLYEAANFPANDPQTGWDGNFRGQPMNTGVYTWYVEVTFASGKTAAFKGHTTLLR